MGQKTGQSTLRQPVVLVALLVSVLLVWQLRSLFLLVFGGVLVAVLLTAAANAVTRYTGLSRRIAFPLAVAGVLLIALGVTVAVGARLSSEFGQLTRELPRAANDALALLPDAAQNQLNQLRSANLGAGSGILSRLAGVASALLGALADFVLVIFVGLFLAANPGLYRAGLRRLFRKWHRARVFPIMDAIELDLRRWLLGQLISMSAVGTMVWVGLMLLSVPMAAALGIVAGLLEFVPLIGPLAGAVPGILIAFSAGPQTALWAALMYFAIQQIESQILMPLVQRWAVSLAPALTLTTGIGFGLLFGPLGLIFGVPLAVTVKRLILETYVREEENEG